MSPSQPPSNRILRALPREAYATLQSDLHRVELQLKQVLIDVDVPIEYVYFPEACVVSMVGVMADGTAVETATIGNEGMVGLPVFLGTDRTSVQAFTQIPGPALQMPVNSFRRAIDEVPGWTQILNRYTQALFTLVAQSSACNRVHMMTERCARWLLHCHDRVGKATFPLTHQFLSQMLGVRRATVSEAMSKLQQCGVTYNNGNVTIADRDALERAACECYTIITHEFDRLLDAGDTERPEPLRALRTSKDGKSLVGDGAPHILQQSEE